MPTKVIDKANVDAFEAELKADAGRARMQGAAVRAGAPPKPRRPVAARGAVDRHAEPVPRARHRQDLPRRRGAGRTSASRSRRARWWA